MGFRLAAGVVALALALAAWCAPAGAETFKPTKRSDPAPGPCKKKDCSLREAVLAANATPEKDKIVLKGGKPYRLKQEGVGEEASATGDLDVTADLLVAGKPKATVTAKRVDRVFDVPDLNAITLKITKLTVTGGIGGINVGNGGTLKLNRSTVKENKTNNSGGGVAVQAMGTASIKRSTIADNKASAGGGLYATGMTTVLNSTVSGNRSTGTGGGVKAQSSLGFTARNSTFAGNQAETDGGGISVLSGSATLNNVTIARNEADTDETGGGADVGGGISGSGMVDVANSVIALNRLGGDPMPLVDVNCDGTFVSGGGNVRGTDDTGCMGFTGTDDIVATNPKLGPLAKNGGPTKTIALKHGSAAINNAIPASAEPKDQRGVARGAKPDSGAFER